MKYAILILPLVLAACSSTEDKESYRQAQIEIVREQQKSREAMRYQENAVEAAKWEAAKEIVAANPEAADAFAVAMAVSVVQNQQKNDAPIVTLNREQNEGMELLKAMAPALVGTLGQVGIAALNADVAKTNARQSAAIQINDANQDARIVEAVAGVGVAAAAQATSVTNTSTTVAGDMYTAGNDIDQSNSSINDSNNPIDNSVDNTNNAVDNSDNSSLMLTYETTEGLNATFQELLALLQEGINVNVLIDGDVVPVTPTVCPDGSTGLTFGGDSIVCE